MKAAALRQRLDRAVEQDVGVGQLAAALRREAEQGARAALDVDPAVLARRAGEVVELVKLLLAREDGEPEALDDAGAVMEGQLAQRGAADGAGMVEHGGEIDPARSGGRDEAAVDRADDVGARAGARNPLVAGIIEQFGGFHGAIPDRSRGAIRAYGPKSLKSPGALPFWRLSNSAIKREMRKGGRSPSAKRDRSFPTLEEARRRPARKRSETAARVRSCWG